MVNFGAFEKPIYLPSGGLSYPPYAWILPLSQEYILHEHDTKKADSFFADKLSILKKYVKFPVDILDIYVFDIQYVWIYLLLEYILNDRFYFITGKCNQCEYEYHIKIDLTNTIISYFNKYLTPIDTNLIYIPYSNVNIELHLELRRAKHNISYSNLLFSMPYDSEDFIYKSIIYIATQISNLYYNKEKLPEYEYIPCLLSLSHLDIQILLLHAFSFNYKYGIHNKYKVKCSQCGTESQFFLFNDLYEAYIQPYYQPTQLTKHAEIFKNIFEVVRLPILSYEEYSNVPIHLIRPMIEALNNMDFHPGVVL